MSPYVTMSYHGRSRRILPQVTGCHQRSSPREVPDSAIPWPTFFGALQAPSREPKRPPPMKSLIFGKQLHKRWDSLSLSMIINDCQWLSTIHWSSMILATVSAPPWALAACIAPSRLPQRTPRLWRPPLGSRRTRTRHRAWKPKAPAKSLPLRTYINYILGNAVSST